MTPAEFVSFFCATHRGRLPGTEVRIGWRYLNDTADQPKSARLGS